MLVHADVRLKSASLMTDPGALLRQLKGSFVMIRRIAPGGTCQELMLRRPTRRDDCTAVLAPRSRR